ncbi:lysophospholipid acyltransferase family protein [Nocardioides pinisoli]|uniref:Acyltransferase family protein n=1 Tax=Nocardioides pinisoli TaxID=2950279 RepID=A0ABT1KYP9_9ACTN|nr:lysophospholipid acyltransferase family protein [Nocardioides pinisoli]MCP3421746.1 acyltransferase family protein [Nocardioides pinisoli]
MPEEARRRDGEDAVVIPIGTGGRPGRGSGSARPSSAARNLAPSSRKASSAKPRRAGATDAPGKKARAGSGRATGSADETVVTPPTGGEAAKPPTTGIPVADWLAAAQGAAQEVFGADWERRAAELMAFCRRRLEGDYEVDDYGFDRELTERFFMAALRPIAEKWFRLEVRGLENIPAEGGALVVSNHSGTIPLDGLMTMLTVHDHAGRFLRPLGADLVFKLPVVSALARAGGATLACTEDAERMLSEGQLVGVWPEGFKGIGKPFSERYKLQRFGRGGFVSAALRTGVPIIPLSVVGAEEIYPLVGNVPSLARLLGVPYIPITPFFPWLGPLGLVPLPSKWILEFGEPIRTDAYEPGEAEDPMLVFNVTDQVRETIQHTLFDLLRDRGGVFG